MAKHIVSACPTAPADIKLKYSHYLKRKVQPPPSPVTKNGANNASEEAPPPSEQPAHHISAQEQAEFQYDLAKTVYAMGSSFRSVGHPANTWFFAKHKPGYRLPNRHQVSGPLLDKAYDEQQVEVYEGIRRHPYVSIVMDGYTDTNSEHIINYMIVAPDLRPLFWGSIRAQAERQTGTMLATELLKTIKAIEDVSPSTKIVGVVTDNAKNMKSAWEKVRLKRKDIINIGCAAHALNLVLEAIFKLQKWKEVKDHAVTISKFIKNRSILLALFRQDQRVWFPKQKGRVALALPVPTGWYSNQRCIRAVVRNREVICELFKDEELMNNIKGDKLDAIQKVLNSSEFWGDARSLLMVTQPISKSMALLEGDNCSMSKIYQEFRRLETHEVYKSGSLAPAELRSQVLDVIQARWRKYRVPVMGVSFLLDPATDHKAFDGDDGHSALFAAIGIAESQGYRGSKLDAFRTELGAFIKEKEM